MVRSFGIYMSLLGAILLLISIAGHWTVLGKYESASPREWERFDLDLVEKSDNFLRLNEAAKEKLSDNADEREIMDVLYTMVADRFTHKNATHSFLSNWLLYLAGKINPAFSHIYDSNLLVSKGHSLFCDQSSYVLLSLAFANGIKSRHVGLDGHVVMEAWYDSDWHLYDPDLEVVPLDSTGSVLSVEKLALNQELIEMYYGLHGAVNIVGSRENNTYMSYPEGARYEWKVNLLAHFERVMEVVKFILPMVFILAGFWLVYRQT